MVYYRFNIIWAFYTHQIGKHQLFSIRDQYLPNGTDKYKMGSLKIGPKKYAGVVLEVAKSWFNINWRRV